MNNSKKLPTKQLEKFSTIFTQLGLVLVLFIVYITLEHETLQKQLAILDEDIPERIFIEPDQDVIVIKEPKNEPTPEVPQQQPFIPDEVVKGDNDIIETVIDDPSEDIVEIDPEDIIEVDEGYDIKPEDEVDFIRIENAPVFKGCEGLSKEENKICFDKKMKRFVQRNFDLNLANELGLNSGKYRISTEFIIDAKGNVVDVKIRAPHPKLKKETDKMINKLPHFTPGKQRNKPVKVRYTLPITFRVD
ncbi:energy transducer TonB [Polaribacter porphyrae]|uniref:TonB C-terminal domain-containing protein n=1 Tax=Polaribacter porphyrae TaxID=1137780 RepID=A0A2S7WR25_9FLAO|nr:energy transducer TonB [Polaribacter porphyrae]PQJ80058.1 hypothetical protein BTO18_13135 [Polaribacter porphyrae]